jgi:type IV pilus assembly protein PilA
MNKRTGFTLIEMLVVIGIIAILAAVVLVAVNPLRQFANARDVQRRADLHSISSSVYQYAIDNNGDLSALAIPVGIAPDDPDPLMRGTCIGTDPACIDLGATLVPRYVAGMPFDPSTGSLANSAYTVYQSATEGRITVWSTCESDTCTSNFIIVSR